MVNVIEYFLKYWRVISQNVKTLRTEIAGRARSADIGQNIPLNVRPDHGSHPQMCMVDLQEHISRLEGPIYKNDICFGQKPIVDALI